MPSASVSNDMDVTSKGSEPQAISSASNCPSLSSSVSALFPMPSASVSNHSSLSNGKASFASSYPSLSSSVSIQSAMPSASVSNGLEEANSGSEPQAISSWSLYPSLSSSLSQASPAPSPSVFN